MIGKDRLHRRNRFFDFFDVQKNYPGAARMGFDRIASSIEYQWNINGISMEYQWNINGISMEYKVRHVQVRYSGI